MSIEKFQPSSSHMDLHGTLLVLSQVPRRQLVPRQRLRRPRAHQLAEVGDGKGDEWWLRQGHVGLMLLATHDDVIIIPSPRDCCFGSCATHSQKRKKNHARRVLAACGRPTSHTMSMHGFLQVLAEVRGRTHDNLAENIWNIDAPTWQIHGV